MVDDIDKSSITDITLAPVRPAVSPKQAVKDIVLFEELKKQLLTKDDYQTIAGKQYIKKSGFRRISLCFNLSDRILEQERTDREDGTFTWRIVAEVEAPNGRVCSGVGICDSKERKFAHVEHDVYATAHTRAKNRAISDMVAGGIVSAEEMNASTRNETTTLDIKTNSTVLDKDGIIDALESVGLDVENLEIVPDDGKMIVKPTKFLGDIWDRYNTELWKAGLSWIKDGKNGRWERVLP